MLFLCGHFHWLPTGYAVLLALASMAVVILFLFLWFAAALVLRRRFQYSFRTMLLGMLLASVGMSCLAVRLQQARRQRAALESLSALEANVVYDCESDLPDNVIAGPIVLPSEIAWLRGFLGEDFFADAIRLTLFGLNTTDSDLRALKALPRLRALHVFCAKKITDAELEPVESLRQLEDLELGAPSSVTDAGLQRLKALTRLKKLSISDSNITDVGLENLRALTRLRTLDLSGTKITDAGLKYLGALTQLQILNVEGCRVTHGGLAGLQKLLPNCKIMR